MRIGKAISRNCVAGSLGRAIAALTPIVVVPLMIRTWGLHVYGEWLILTAIPSYIMLCPDFGLAGAVVNQMAIATAAGNRRDAISLYRTSWVVLTGMAACFALAGTVAAAYLKWSPLGITLLSRREATAMIAWSCVQIFLGQQMFLMGGVYRSARRNSRGALLASCGAAFTFLAGCAALAYRCDPLAYACVQAAAKTLTLGAMLVDTRHIMPDFTLGREGISLRAVRPFVAPGLGHAAMPLMHALQNEATVLVLALLLGPVSVAVFQTTRTAVNGVKSISGLVESAVLVEIPSLVGEGRMDVVRRILVINTHVAVGVAVGFLTLLGAFGRSIFHLWLGSATVYSAPLVLLMLASMFPFALGNSFRIALMATNQIHRAAIALLAAAIGSLAGTAGITVLLGLNGAALGLIGYEVLILIAVCAAAAKHTSIHVKEILAEVFSIRSFGQTYNSAAAAFRLAR
jgi:O-antigen/teichoic acid export membrane protein